MCCRSCPANSAASCLSSIRPSTEGSATATVSPFLRRRLAWASSTSVTCIIRLAHPEQSAKSPTNPNDFHLQFFICVFLPLPVRSRHQALSARPTCDRPRSFLEAHPQE